VNGLQIFLLGRFQVHYGEAIAEGFEGQKVQELLCYLLLKRERPQPRESLASVLWGDVNTSKSKSYLRKALWQCQSALESISADHNLGLLHVEPEWIQINPDAVFWLDIAMFEDVYTSVQNISGCELDCQSAQTVCSAVDLYQGDLMEGWYVDWCLYERERLQHMYLAMVDKLMHYCEAHGEYESGIDYGLQVLRYDRARERTHRRLMRLEYSAGDRTGALRQYERCVVALKEELGVGPAKQTLELYNSICDNRFRPIPVTVRGSDLAAPKVHELLSYLQEIEQILNEAHEALHHRLQGLENIIT
jgi:DNA-binding SARP family transcriptional activator